MPIVTGQLRTYDVNGKPRDLSDVITMISPEDTPFFTLTGTSPKATQTLHEWTTDSLAEPGDNAQLEGADVTDFEESNVTELNNRTQIFRKAVQVSGSAQAIDEAGIDNQYNYQVANRSKELKTDIEYAFLANQIAVAGSATVARRMRGLAAWITTNVDLGAGGAAATDTTAAVAGTARALTHEMIANIMQAAYEQGGNPSVLMAAPAVRRKTTAVLKTVNVQNEDVTDRKSTDTIRVYESDFGEVKIVSNRVQAKVPYSQNALFILEPGRWKKSYLRNITDEVLAKTGDSMKGMILGELTLEARAEQSSGMIADINPAL